MDNKKFWLMVCRVILVFLAVFLLCTFFVLSARAAEVTLQWDANDPAPDGYKLFMRTAGNNYNYDTPIWQGTATTAKIEGLLPATQYYFVARAYVAEDESGDSNEVDFKPDIPPPVNLRISVEISVYIDVNGVPYVAQMTK